jgi:hypothetical protein
MPSQEIQKQIDAVRATQQHNEFGSQRSALLFLPGSHSVDVPVGFYTEVMGPEAIRSRHHEIPISRAKCAREMGTRQLSSQLSAPCAHSLSAE